MCSITTWIPWADEAAVTLSISILWFSNVYISNVVFVIPSPRHLLPWAVLPIPNSEQPTSSLLNVWLNFFLQLLLLHLCASQEPAQACSTFFSLVPLTPKDQDISPQTKDRVPQVSSSTAQKFFITYLFSSAPQLEQKLHGTSILPVLLNPSVYKSLENSRCLTRTCVMNVTLALLGNHLSPSSLRLCPWEHQCPFVHPQISDLWIMSSLSKSCLLSCPLWWVYRAVPSAGCSSSSCFARKFSLSSVQAVPKILPSAAFFSRYFFLFCKSHWLIGDQLLLLGQWSPNLHCQPPIYFLEMDSYHQSQSQPHRVMVNTLCFSGKASSSSRHQSPESFQLLLSTLHFTSKRCVRITCWWT